MRIAPVVSLLLALPACSTLNACSASSSAPPPPDGGASSQDAAASALAECRAEVVQKDLMSQNPDGPDKPPVTPYWFGSSVDRATGKPNVPPGAPVATTYLQLRADANAQQKFGELSASVAATLMTPDGPLAAMLSFSPGCGIARTISVWKDEPSLMRFVTSDAHGKAVAAVSQVSRGGSITTHWVADGTTPLGWETAAAKLEDHRGPVY